MHPGSTVIIGCADCHGGDPNVLAAGAPKSAEYIAATRIRRTYSPRFAEDAARGGHPMRVYTRWLRESLEWVSFVNPGDLRVAPQTCGSSGCHTEEVRNVSTSMMTHGAMLWGRRFYNNWRYFPIEESAFWRILRREWRASTASDFSTADARGDANQRCPAVSPGSAAAMGDFAAGQRAPGL